jgi:hypothetical protein
MLTITRVKQILKLTSTLSGVSTRFMSAANQCAHGNESALFAGAAVIVSAGGLVAKYFHDRYYSGKSERSRKYVDADYGGLAVDCITSDVSSLANSLPTAVAPGETAIAREVVNMYTPIELENVRYNRDPIEIQHHRRIHAPQPYCQAVIAEVKVRFGTPKRTAANERSVHRFASEIMRKHGVRHTEARRIIPLIMESVFTPDKWEIEAMKVGSSPFAMARKYEGSVLHSLLSTCGF